MNRTLRILGALAACATACEKPSVAPGLDQICDGGPCEAPPGVIEGNVVYSGTARGDVVLLLFDLAALPPPDGTGTTAVAVARVPESTMFAGAAPGSIGPFSAAYTFSQVPAWRSYQVRAFVDATHDFSPFFDYTQQPRAGDPVGGHGTPGPGGVAQLAAVDVAAGQLVTGVDVALTQVLPYDPPAFELASGSQSFDVSMDRPANLRLRIRPLTAQNATFADAHFALELDRDAQGNRQSSFDDGLDDVFPRVVLRQTSGLDAQGKVVAIAASTAAIVPCRVISTPVLPALVNLPAGAVPVPLDQIDVLVEPFAVGPDRKPLASIPVGSYEVVVIEKSGQVWTVPNQLGDPSSVQTGWYDASQAQLVTFAAGATAPPNSISGNVVWQGDTTTTSGNIVVQAYLDDPYNPPPPSGAAVPIRVQLIPASGVQATSNGFRVPYRLVGLPAGNYIVEALSDVDHNFSSLNILQTPTRGDLTGAVLSGARAESIAATGDVTRDVTLFTRVPLDPPAFEVEPATPAQMPADQVTPVRFNVRTKPLAFPAGDAPAPHFAVQLMRDAGGQPVDADHDGLPDVWPRAYLVRLDPSDPTGLTPYVSPDLHRQVTQIIPVAVDPTPFLPALQPQTAAGVNPIVTDRLTLIVRPTLLDASTPNAPPQRLPSLQPGAYKIVLVTQTGQVWQIPNEAGTAALDPSVVCPANVSTCPPGTVQTQSQSQAFQVLPPAHQIFAGGIAGTLSYSGTGTPVAAYVFAYASGPNTVALPPFGAPASADFHLGSEFVAGKVNYVLPDLPAGNYVVTAIVDTRGDFAVSPSLFAIAPGAGSSAVASAQPVAVGTAIVSGTNLVASSALPQRPSFQITDASGTPLTSTDNVQVSTAKLYIQAAAVLNNAVAGLRPDTTGAFVFTCDSGGTPQPGSLGVELIKVVDPSGMVPDLDANGKATAIFGTPAVPGGVTCSGGFAAATGPVAVTLAAASAKVNLLNPNDPPTTIPLVSGTYSAVVTSFAKQVWRVPNELQFGLLDPAAQAAMAALPNTRALLQSQGVQVQITP